VKRIWDPYVALSWVAATTSLEIGTAVTLVAEHDPIALAKTIASLDQLSGGRLVLGVGWGWNREEFEDHTGIPAGKRVPVLREKILAMRALWTHDEAEFHGTYVQIPKSWAWPKPAQAGGPPIMVGAPAAQKNFDRIADFADGWLPMSPAFWDDQFPVALAGLRRTWEAAGRSGVPLVTAMAGRPSSDELLRTVERAASLGVQRVLVTVDEDGMSDYERILDACAPALAQLG
jgi:probable F420-dependent oxidoreductase